MKLDTTYIQKSSAVRDVEKMLQAEETPAGSVETCTDESEEKSIPTDETPPNVSVNLIFIITRRKAHSRSVKYTLDSISKN